MSERPPTPTMNELQSMMWQTLVTDYDLFTAHMAWTATKYLAAARDPRNGNEHQTLDAVYSIITTHLLAAGHTNRTDDKLAATMVEGLLDAATAGPPQPPTPKLTPAQTKALLNAYDPPLIGEHPKGQPCHRVLQATVNGRVLQNLIDIGLVAHCPYRNRTYPVYHLTDSGIDVARRLTSTP